ncbi:MAG: TIGR03936 family radical SAM-associated protein [Spirochaetes bacterium]|nr:TIGR03936 family radical SAM-associated protein [Spirochaetota bacterium]
MHKKLTESDIRTILMQVENPGRYAGGEYGSHNKKYTAAWTPCSAPAASEGNILKMAISYPDMYDIGMSNNAIKILYNLFNTIDGVVCDRVFAPAPDFEKLLKEMSLPLFTLESNAPLCCLDLLGFTFGYELTATNLLNILDLGKIPLYNSCREKNHPIVIAGGLGITNPAPYGDFIDLFFMGEAEEEFEKLLCEIVKLKKAGAERDEILLLMAKHKNVWHKGKSEKVYRAVYNNFAGEYVKRKYNLVPSVKPVQDNGVVEIMRGCPNGCRFCHAGFFYRPKREKDYKVIDQEVEELVFESGHREITLSSLSSGDYSCLNDIIEKLNKKYSGIGVSFSLPSLKINSFTVSLLSKIGEVRKSGLTFAVETPDPSSQRAINKEIDLDQTITIIKEAKLFGWKIAKFYFMIGLPAASIDEEMYCKESDNIIDFLFKVQAAAGIDINVNIGTFVPKPHTPFQWAPQMKEAVAMKQIHYIKNKLKGRNIKVGYHSPMMSFVEGIFSRGDERAGKLLFDAWQAGARFDAWEEHFDIALWRKVIESQPWNAEEEICRKRDAAEKFPWAGISMGTSKKYLLDEYNNSCDSKLTSKCETTCTHNCGVCGKYTSISQRTELCERRFPAGIVNSGAEQAASEEDVVFSLGTGEDRYRIIFSFSKKGKQIYLGHLDVMRLFEKAFQRCRLEVRFTEGFNPKPRLEFANPLTLGIESEEEIASVETYTEYEKEQFITKVNNVLPDGIKIINIFSHKIIHGEKKISLMSLYSGSVYKIFFPQNSNYKTLLEDYVRRNSLEQTVRIEDLDTRVVSADDPCAVCQGIRLWNIVKPGSKSLFKILKEALNRENPLAEIIVIREWVFAGEDLSNYLSYFGERTPAQVENL